MPDLADWVRRGVGQPPEVVWTAATEGRLTHLAFARESGETVAADDAGGVSVFDADGRLRLSTRGLSCVAGLAVADAGGAVAVAYDERKLTLLDEKLAARWTLRLYDAIVGLAVDPFGRHVAVALANRDVRVYGADKRKLAAFETPRPPRFLHFAATRPLLTGAADHGLLAAWTPGGKPLWDAALWTTCGDLAASGDAQTLFLAAHSHGVQRFDGAGTNRGTFVVEGTPVRVACGFDATRLGVATLERQVYRLDGRGGLLWAAPAPDDVAALAADGPGRDLLVGFAGGRVQRLRWFE